MLVSAFISAEQIIAGILADYIVRMAVDARFLTRASMGGPTEIYKFSSDEMTKFAITWNDLEYSDWTLEPYKNGLIGVSKTKNSANTATLFCRKDRTLRLLLSLQNRFNLSPVESIDAVASPLRLDPDACMEDLVGNLSALGIAPIGFGRSPNLWTEFRTVPLKSAEKPHRPPDTEDTKATASVDAILSPVEMPPEDMASVVEIGDRVQVQVDGDRRVRVVTLTANRHDPDVGIISAQHPSGAALLGAEEDEEIEFEIGGKPYQWMVVQIEKAQEYAAT
jgi:hypothetical protein